MGLSLSHLSESSEQFRERRLSWEEALGFGETRLGPSLERKLPLVPGRPLPCLDLARGCRRPLHGSRYCVSHMGWGLPQECQKLTRTWVGNVDLGGPGPPTSTGSPGFLVESLPHPLPTSQPPRAFEPRQETSEEGLLLPERSRQVGFLPGLSPG